MCESQVGHSRLLRAASSTMSRHACRPTTAQSVPPLSEAEKDHERLLERFRFYGIEEYKVKGDGNCQVRQTRELWASCIQTVVSCRYSIPPLTAAASPASPLLSKPSCPATLPCRMRSSGRCRSNCTERRITTWTSENGQSVGWKSTRCGCAAQPSPLQSVCLAPLTQRRPNARAHCRSPRCQGVMSSRTLCGEPTISPLLLRARIARRTTMRRTYSARQAGAGLRISRPTSRK